MPARRRCALGAFASVRLARARSADALVDVGVALQCVVHDAAEAVVRNRERDRPGAVARPARGAADAHEQVTEDAPDRVRRVARERRPTEVVPDAVEQRHLARAIAVERVRVAAEPE